jgi:hypothetical protein
VVKNPSVTISQSVTIPTGFWFWDITILPILSIFMFSAISLMLELEDERIRLLMTSLTSTLLLSYLHPMSAT